MYRQSPSIGGQYNVCAFEGAIGSLFVFFCVAVQFSLGPGGELLFAQPVRQHKSLLEQGGDGDRVIGYFPLQCLDLVGHEPHRQYQFGFTSA